MAQALLLSLSMLLLQPHTREVRKWMRRTWTERLERGLVLRKISNVAFTPFLSTRNRVHETTLAQQLLIRITWIRPHTGRKKSTLTHYTTVVTFSRGYGLVQFSQHVLPIFPALISLYTIAMSLSSMCHCPLPDTA